MRISDWSSDVCSSDLPADRPSPVPALRPGRPLPHGPGHQGHDPLSLPDALTPGGPMSDTTQTARGGAALFHRMLVVALPLLVLTQATLAGQSPFRSEERRAGNGEVSSCGSRSAGYH